MSKTAREFVTGVGECVNEYETVLEGARKLADLGVDALPICREDRSVLGMLSERDVVRIVAARQDPDAIRLGRLASDDVPVVDADAPIAAAWRSMIERGLARMPVIDGGRLVGMLHRAELGGRLAGEPHVSAAVTAALAN